MRRLADVAVFAADLLLVLRLGLLSGCSAWPLLTVGSCRCPLLGAGVVVEGFGALSDRVRYFVAGWLVNILAVDPRVHFGRRVLGLRGCGLSEVVAHSF